MNKFFINFEEILNKSYYTSRISITGYQEFLSILFLKTPSNFFFFYSSSVSRSSSRQGVYSSPSSSSISYYPRTSRYCVEKYSHRYRSHSSSYDDFDKFSKRKSRASSNSSSVVVVSSSSSPSSKFMDEGTAESVKLIREIKPDFNLSETSLFAELVKDKRKRELVLKNLADMEKKKQEMQKPKESNGENVVAPSSVVCVTDIIKEIPLPPPIPCSFSSFLSSTPISDLTPSPSIAKSVAADAPAENARKKDAAPARHSSISLKSAVANDQKSTNGQVLWKMSCSAGIVTIYDFTIYVTKSCNVFRGTSEVTTPTFF